MIETNDEIVAGNFDNVVYRINKLTFSIISSFNAERSTTKLAYSSEYNLLMATGYYAKVFVYNITNDYTLLHTLSYHEQPIFELEISVSSN